MKIIHFNQAEHIKVAEKSTAHEYGVGESAIDSAFIEIDGAYPDNGKFAVNSVSKEILFVIAGAGVFEVKNKTGDIDVYEFGQHDVIFVDIGDIYRFNAQKAAFCVSCAPAWSPEQHQFVD